jgi:hypothetical protein
MHSACLSILGGEIYFQAGVLLRWCSRTDGATDIPDAQPDADDGGLPVGGHPVWSLAAGVDLVQVDDLPFLSGSRLLL